MVIKDCMLHEKNGKQWIAFPGKPYIKDGAQSWVNIIDFADSRRKYLFQDEVLPLVRRFWAQPGSLWCAAWICWFAMVTAMTDVSEALDFLENVFGNRDRHLVAIEAGGNPKKIVGRFFDPHDSGVASWVSGHNQKYGIYYTVNELSDQFQGSKPTKGDVAKARFLHVDIDSEDGFERPRRMLSCSSQTHSSWSPIGW
jgi:hypothetical protein